MEMMGEIVANKMRTVNRKYQEKSGRKCQRAQLIHSGMRCICLAALKMGHVADQEKVFSSTASSYFIDPPETKQGTPNARCPLFIYFF
ncbi:MAG: hypothetical protein C4518_05535 [Desulfobacteraceae bacterium]|nr:MAG: hypothetical protein C4518_05535 [Desulfobacteraceae bacterium]